jgi:acyl-coenzyme A thioesterase PaaI-like protein
MSTSSQHFRERLINFYPPYLGAGIHSRRIDEYTTRVEMKLTALNRNILGTHFGGSLYAMCDPWFVLILMRALGPDYIVWDKAASIQFLRPGRGKVTATFHIPVERIDEIRQQVDGGGRTEPTFVVDVLDPQGKAVARVEKVLYVRKKKERNVAI